MAFIATGLTNGGRTAHYEITYEESLSPAEGADIANGLVAKCEQDWTLMQGWFGGIELTVPSPIPVQITNQPGGGTTLVPAGFWLDLGVGTDILLRAGPGASVDLLRYLLVSEVTELFMLAKGSGWFEGHGFFYGGDEGSKGEGLSRFLGVQFQLANGLGDVPPPGYAVSHIWLNSARQDFVNVAPDDHAPDAINGCTTLFLYYLSSQRNFGIEAIIAAQAPNLAGVYANLTGLADGWTSFIDLVNSHYPPGFTYNPSSDNIFPVANLAAFWPPSEITCGYSQLAHLFMDRPAKAEVNINLLSDDPSLVIVPSSVVIQPGSNATSVYVATTAIPIPFAPKFVNVHASYGGKTLTISVEVVPPAVETVTLSPDTVVCGNESVGTINVSLSSLLGDIVVDLVCGEPFFATVPTQVVIHPNQPSGQFTIETPNILIPFVPAHPVIFATYAGSSASATLTVNPKVIKGIISSLTLLPATVVGGSSITGIVTLFAAVPTPTLVGLAAQEIGPGPGGGGASVVASVPPSITIPPGHTTSIFQIFTAQLFAPENVRTAIIVAAAVNVKYASLKVTR